MCVKEDIIAAGCSMPARFRLKAIVTQRLVSGNNYFAEKLSHYRNLLAATELIDFECGFDESGMCKDRQCIVDDRPNAPMCCCSGCAYTNGYHRDKVMCKPSELRYLRNRFDPYLGFWRPGKGCILERSRRSITCVFYNCFRGKRTKAADVKGKHIANLKNLAYQLHDELEEMIWKGLE
jgi:hypothetical protein